MLNEKQALELYTNRKNAKTAYAKTPNPTTKSILNKCETACAKAFMYLIKGDASHYRNFHNHEDLLQEGLIVLFKALDSYKPNRGNIFYWLHRYVETKIKRQANKHCVVNVPLQKAKALDLKNIYFISPHITDSKPSVENVVATAELNNILDSAMKMLPEEQRILVSAYYGLDGRKNLQDIAVSVNMSKEQCRFRLRSAITKMKRVANSVNMAKSA